MILCGNFSRVSCKVLLENTIAGQNGFASFNLHCCRSDFYWCSTTSKGITFTSTLLIPVACYQYSSFKRSVFFVQYFDKSRTSPGLLRVMNLICNRASQINTSLRCYKLLQLPDLISIILPNCSNKESA